MGVQPATRLRFLRAKSYNADAAAKMLLNHLSWRAEVQPEQIQVTEGSELVVAVDSGGGRCPDAELLRGGTQGA